ncbi:MAG: hypothetical protein KF754_15920 [Planctomycetes bacterium]|nr:hypothetical protein [Planctomycetota bacterium]
MTRLQFVAGLFVTGLMAMAGGVLATFMLHSPTPIQAQPGNPGKVEATEFRLVDAKGNPRASMSTSEKGAVTLTFFDKDLKPRMQLGADGDQASLTFLDASGTPRYLVCQQNKDNNVLITFQDAKGQARYMQSLSSDGTGLLSIRGPKEQDYVTLMAGSESGASLILQDPDNKAQAVLLAGKAQTSLTLDRGKASLLAASLEGGQSVLGLSYESKLRLRAMTGADGSPEYMTLNDKREAVWRSGK